MDAYCYEIPWSDTNCECQQRWDSSAWKAVDSLEVDQFHSRSSNHRPRTRVKLMYDTQGLHVRFDVQDRFVRCVHQGYQRPVSADSCVEFFVQPQPGRGYFNFEVNCGGAMLAYHIVDCSQKPGGGFKSFSVLPDTLLDQVAIYHSLPQRVEPEIADPVNWRIGLTIPWRFFAAVLGPVTPTPGTCWRANFYKCGGHTSHPHWASWSPVGEVLNFHKPECFGTIRFGDVIRPRAGQQEESDRRKRMDELEIANRCD